MNKNKKGEIIGVILTILLLIIIVIFSNQNKENKTIMENIANAFIVPV